MAHANFQGCERLAASHDVAVQRMDGGHIFGMGAMPEIDGGDFPRLVTENLLRTRADEGVVGADIEHENEIREAVDQATGKFLLLVEAALHFAPLGDVHNRALISHDMAGAIANGGGGVQANNGCSVLANEGDFAALKRRLALDLFLDDLSLGLVHEDLGYFSFEKVILGIVAKHAHEGRICIQDGPFRRDDVDAVNLVRAHHGMGDAIEVEHRRLALQANLDDALPVATLHKTRHGALHELHSIAIRVLDELGQGLADNLLEGRVNEIRKTAVDRANLAVKAKSEQNVIEGVNQVAIALLGAGDDFEELVELLVARRFGIALLEAVHEAAELGNLRGFFPEVDAEKGNEGNQSDRQGLVAVRHGTDGIPVRPGIGQDKEEKYNEGKPPQLALALFEAFEARSNGGTALCARR